MTSHAPAAPSPGVAIYLPRGPLRANPEDDESNISILRPSLSHPLVKVNYRWGKDHQYPTPIHDVASAFDFVISNLLPRRALVRDGRSEHIGRLAVCGELIGGQLATTMALTECRMGEPAVVAAAVSNPIANWTEIDEIATADEQPSGVASPRLTVHDIRAQRDALFRKPEHYFDPFASPTLFLRSAGINVPKTAQLSPLDDMDELAMLERDFFRDQLALSGKGGTETAERDAQELPSKKRKASRRFPGQALRLRLPDFLLSAGAESAARSQAAELAHLLSQSMNRQKRKSCFGSKIMAEDELMTIASDKVRYEECEGIGLWNTSNEGRRRMKRAAAWLEHVLLGSQ